MRTINMAKRYTETTIWDEDWFLNLPIEYAMFWVYVKDKCDFAGIWKPNIRGFENSFTNNSKIELNKALELFNAEKERICVLPSGRWLLVDFFVFQYGNTMNGNNRVHLSIYNIYKKEGVNLGSIRGLIEVKHTPKDKDILMDTNNGTKDYKEELIGGVGGKFKDIKDEKQYCAELKKLTVDELNEYQQELYKQNVFNTDETIPERITFKHPGEIRYRLDGMFRAAVGDVMVKQGVVYRTGEDKPVDIGEWPTWCKSAINGVVYGKMMTPEQKLADLVQFCIEFTEGDIATLSYKRNLKEYLRHMKNAYQSKWAKVKK